MSRKSTTELRSLVSSLTAATEAEVFKACENLSSVDICHMVTMAGPTLQFQLLRVLRSGD